MLLWFILANRVDVFCSVINVLGYVCQLRHHITFQKQRIYEVKERIYMATIFVFLWLGISDNHSVKFLWILQRSFGRRLSRKHVFCENWLSGNNTLQYVGLIFNGPAVDCLNIEGCPRTSVLNYHSALHKIPEECRSHEKFIFSATAVIILIAIRLLQSCLGGVLWHGVNLQIWPKWVAPIIRSRTVHISVLSKSGVRAVNPAHIWLGYISC